VTETNLLNYLMQGGADADDAVGPIVHRQVTTVGSGASLESVMGMFADGSAVVILDQERVAGIITKIDLIDFLAARSK
jgi:cystathionine beta-synthase